MALWRLTVHDVVLPGRWSIMDRRFISQFTSATALLQSSLFYPRLLTAARPGRKADPLILGRKIDDRGQDRSDDDPQELVPIKERNAGPRRLDRVVEGWPEHRDELDHKQQIPPAPARAGAVPIGVADLTPPHDSGQFRQSHESTVAPAGSTDRGTACGCCCSATDNNRSPAGRHRPRLHDAACDDDSRNFLLYVSQRFALT